MLENLPKQEMQEKQGQSLDWEDALEEDMAPTPVFLPGKSHGQSSLAGCGPGGCKESDMTEHTEHLLFIKITQSISVNTIQ